MLRPVTSTLLDGRTQWPGSFDPRAVGTPGHNFATQDYLALRSHPALRALAAASESDVPTDPAKPVATLESRLARFLGLPSVTACASGSDAIRAVLEAVLRPGDHLIADVGAHPAMFETTLAAQAHLLRCPAGSLAAVERRLLRLSRQQLKGRIFLAVPTVSAHASRVADLAELSALARAYGAILIADVTHDLGAMGQNGGGVMEIQGCMGRIDIVLGSLAKSFGTSGGFAAFRDPALRHAVKEQRAPALAPANARVILAAIDIVDSPEGRRRRRSLHGAALRLRNHLMADGVRVMGQTSPLVLVRLPPLTALPRTALLESAGPKVTLLQAPVVSAHAPRWRFQLKASHGAADIDDLAELIRDVTRAFDRPPGAVHRVEPAALG